MCTYLFSGNLKHRLVVAIIFYPRPNRPTSRGLIQSMHSMFSSFFQEDQDGKQQQQRRLQNKQNSQCTTDGIANLQFNEAIRRLTPFTTAEMSRSLLNDTDTSLVARCSTNWWAVTRGRGIAAVTCDQFEAQDCANNQDLPFGAEDVHCLEPSSMPSASPSAKPSASPSYSPTISAAPSTSFPTNDESSEDEEEYTV